MRYLLLATAASMAVPSAASAAAPLLWGSHSFNTYRKCTDPVGVNCNLPRAYAVPTSGGWFKKVDTDITMPSGSRAAAIVDFSNQALPLIRAASYAAADERVNMNVVAVQGFQNTGTRSIDLAFKGSLHFVNSYDNGVFGEAAGEGILGFHFAIFSAAKVNGTNIANYIPNATHVFDACGTAGVLARGFIGSDNLSGDHTLNFNLAQGCSGRGVSVGAGESVYLMAFLQSPSNRGGFVDAMSTLRVQYDFDKIVYTDSDELVGARTFAQTVQNSVPEPASWALMIGGFGLAGTAARRRRATTALA